ncbi:lrrc23 [Symbiodinium sp. CCMP2592]|nr:lrrc23 [Symbiodinium sp. CCMP2592]
MAGDEGVDLTAEAMQLSEVSKTVAGGGFVYSRVDCISKQIRGLGLLAEYPFLRHLDLSRNCIKDVSPVGKLQHVLSLNLSSNAIPKLDWAAQELPHLLFLDLSKNQLQELPQLHMPALRRADFRFNQISTCADFQGHSTLQTLRLSSNQLASAAGLNKSPKLEVLELSENALADLNDVYRLPCLSTLEISKNKFESLIAPWHEMAALKVLDVSQNAFADASALKPLEVMKELRSLVVAGCPVEEQAAGGFQTETRRIPCNRNSFDSISTTSKHYVMYIYI